MDRMDSLTVNQVQWGYIAIVVLMAVLVVLLGRKRQFADANAVAYMMDWFEVRGIGVIYQFIVFISIFGMIWIAWLLPVQLENWMNNTENFSSPFPHAMSTIGRLAQVVGAVSAAVIGLKSIRYVVPIMLFMLAIVGIYFGFQYIGYQF